MTIDNQKKKEIQLSVSHTALKYLHCFFKFCGLISRVCEFSQVKRRQWSVSKVKGWALGSLSAGADAVDGDDGGVHQAQLLVLVDAQLVAAAPPALQRGDLGVGLGARAAGGSPRSRDQHVPDAVDVEVVLLRLHEGVEGHGGRGDHGARQEEEHPALPGGRVAAPPPDGAHGLTGQQTHNTRFNNNRHNNTFQSVVFWIHFLIFSSEGFLYKPVKLSFHGLTT